MTEIIVSFAALDWIFGGGFVLIFQSAARVAELVDAHGSGPCDLTIMGVRVPPRAPVRPGQETGPVFCCLARAAWAGFACVCFVFDDAAGVWLMLPGPGGAQRESVRGGRRRR